MYSRNARVVFTHSTTGCARSVAHSLRLLAQQGDLLQSHNAVVLELTKIKICHSFLCVLIYLLLSTLTISCEELTHWKYSAAGRD